MCHSKSTNDKLAVDKNSPKADKFLEICGTKSLLKILTFLSGKKIDEIQFEIVRRKLCSTINQSRLIIADISQNEGES